MDIVNFPAFVKQHGFLSAADIDILNDLLIIGRKANNKRNGTQYVEVPMKVSEFLTLASGTTFDTIELTRGLQDVSETIVITTSGKLKELFSAGGNSFGIFCSGKSNGIYSNNINNQGYEGNNIVSLIDNGGDGWSAMIGNITDTSFEFTWSKLGNGLVLSVQLTIVT